MDSETKQRTVVEHLDNCTVRIETDVGKVGTGFFFAEGESGAVPSQGKGYAPLVVTNKHVLEGARAIRVVLSVLDRTDRVSHVGFHELLSNLAVTHHPDGVDLSSINIAPLIQWIESKGLTHHGTWLDRNLIPSEDKVRELAALSDIVMVGYPTGLWDDVNNKPIFRRGVTATNPAIPWQGQSEFLIDVAVFGGSSGSPVFLYSNGLYAVGDNIHLGARLLLIGINKAVYLHTAEGSIKIVDVPTEKKAVPITGIPNNLGICISIQDIDRLLRDAVRPRPSGFYGGYTVSFETPS